MKIPTLLYWSYWFRPNLPSSKFNIAFVSLPKMEWKKCITMRSTKYSNSKLWTGNKLLFRFHASHGCIGGVSEQRSHDRTQVLWLNQMKQSKRAGTMPSFKSLLLWVFKIYDGGTKHVYKSLLESRKRERSYSMIGKPKHPGWTTAHS